MEAGPLWSFGPGVAGAGTAGRPRAAAPPRAVAPPWDWLAGAAAAFQARLLAAEPYPCDFGVHGQQRGHNCLTAVDSRLPGEHGVPALAAALLAFARRAAHGPPRQSLVAFCGPPDDPTDAAQLEQHSSRFWRLLAELSAEDPAPWPAAVPGDPAHPRWQWCFGGQPWFVFALSPAYLARRSRSVGTCLTLVFQTPRVFQGLSGSTPAGQQAKRRIRARLVEYDGMPAHPHLGDAEHSSTHKWRQYVLPDDGRIFPPDQCPITTAPRHRPGG